MLLRVGKYYTIKNKHTPTRFSNSMTPQSRWGGLGRAGKAGWANNEKMRAKQLVQAHCTCGRDFPGFMCPDRFGSISILNHKLGPLCS
jgi:hypothetical protein